MQQSVALVTYHTGYVTTPFQNSLCVGCFLLTTVAARSLPLLPSALFLCGGTPPKFLAFKGFFEEKRLD